MLLAAPVARGDDAKLDVRKAADAGQLAGEVGQGKPVLLHFWATWCYACTDEFPRLKSLLLALPARGMAVATVSIDRPADASTAAKMLGQFGVASLPAFLLDAPSPDPVAAAVGDKSWEGTLPATFLFNARGERVKSFIGVADMKKLERAIDKLVGKQPTAPATPSTAQH